MQFSSFDTQDPIFEVDGWQLSFQVITLENVYGLAPEQTTLHTDDSGWRLRADGLSWAGGQQRAAGGLTVTMRRDARGHLRLRASASAEQKITTIKILARGLPTLKPLDMLDQARDMPVDGLLDRYPNMLRLPVWLVQISDERLFGFRCEDPDYRAKRFCSYRERMGPLAGETTVECLIDQDARFFDVRFDAPEWILARDIQPADFRGQQLAFYETATGLKPWAERHDFPAWARDIRLVLTLHGMHWSGYMFNNYAAMRDIVRYVTERIEGRHVLVYLPGWEGRYYWQYGDFRPEPLLGGAAGFARLCEAAQDARAHLMPMFGGNCANAWLPNFHTFGPSSIMKTATRNPFLGNQPDWNTSRAHDTGWQAWLNPGAPAWQTELTRQIFGLLDTYDLHAVFLDTVEVWTNDPDFNILEGYRQLVGRLRADRPDLLVSGEDWFDGLLSIFPIFQQSSKWRQVPDWGGRYARLMGHICDGEASRGSTGVFESGYAPYERLPDKSFYLPTLAFVDGTLAGAREEIDAVITLANQRG